jgi:hypothetical protein
MVKPVGSHLMPSGVDFPDEVRQTFGDPTENEKGRL